MASRRPKGRCDYDVFHTLPAVPLRRGGVVPPTHGSVRPVATGAAFSLRPRLEVLEDRTMLSIFTVTNTGDNGGVNPWPSAGTGTLRQAIVDADAAATGTAANPDLIQFDIPTTDPGYQSSTGSFSIQPLSALPTITDTVVLDGYTQPGASPNTLAIGDNAVLKIVLDGSLAGSVDGLVIAGGNSTVRGLVIDNFAAWYRHRC